MAIKQIVTRRGKNSTDTVLRIVTDNNRVVFLTKGDLTRHNTPAKLKAEAARQLKREASEFFFHLNRDGSLAVATGKEPEVWPEDEPETEL